MAANRKRGLVLAFIQAIAVDFDGTLTAHGNISAAAIEVIDNARRNGLVVVLVTGRIGVELDTDFPDITAHFDAVVLENGAVALREGKTSILAPPVEEALDDVLTVRGIPYRRGEVLLAADSEHTAAIVGIIGELGLDCQLVHNRSALMVLPAGVTKGTGLEAVLAALNLSPHNAVAIGDAENDLSLFTVAEIGVAVANAVSSLRRHADLLLEEQDGAGVEQLLTSSLLSRRRRWCPPRRWIDIGTFEDGSPTRVPGSQARILVTGSAGSGKSYLVGLMAERWIQAGYCVVVLDPEGDHLELRELNQVEVVDARHHLPDPSELVNSLRPSSSIVVDLSALTQANKMAYLHGMHSAAEAHREACGFPHWVIYDEAHLLGPDEQPPWTRRGGYVLASFAPAALPANEIDSTDIVLELIGEEASHDVTSLRAYGAFVRFGSGSARPFTLAGRKTAHVRHRHKYADVSLPRHRRFYFHVADGESIAPAGTMDDFRAAVARLDPRVLEYHLERGDFSRWLRDTIADQELADQVARWEDDLMAHRAAEVERIRRQLGQAVDERYLGPQF